MFRQMWPLVLALVLWMPMQAGAQASLAPPAAVLESKGFPLFDGESLRGRVVEHAKGNRASAADGVLHVSKDAGWVRTQRTAFETFALRFDARTANPRARALLAIFGKSAEAGRDLTSYAVTLFGNRIPDRGLFLHALVMVMPQSASGAAAALGPVGDWQAYQIVRTESRIVVSLNGTIIINQQGPRTLDGWIGFLADGDAEFRNIRISAVPPEPSTDIYRPGPDVSLPRLLHEGRPNYTPGALARRIEGTVLLECVVGPDGMVSSAVVVRSLDQEYGLDTQAVLAAERWRFAPGLRMGKPVSVLVTIELTFSIGK